MSDQMVVMESGVVQQGAPPREVYERPANMFVAGFVGSPRINLVQRGTLGIPEGRMEGRADVVVGVRPEDVFVGGGVAPKGAVQGRVYVAELVGASTWVTLEIAGERVIGHASADFVPRSGAPAWARLALDRVHFFDRRTTKRIER
jgi:multiple sugar transport system ATP-binding protein